VGGIMQAGREKSEAHHFSSFLNSIKIDVGNTQTSVLEQ